jgi:DNA-binding response OmpR family regulator
VLVVDDDPTVSSVVAAYLRREGFEPQVVEDGRAAADAWDRWKPDVVVLDLMLPGLPGLDLLRRRRAEGDETLVVVLSALHEEDDRILGLEVGADDYLTKPFSPRELVLRIASLVRRDERRRAETLLPSRLAYQDLVVDLAARTASLAGVPLDLPVRQLDLLAYLATYPGRTFSKHELLRRVWGWDFGDTSTVAVHVRRLRERLETDPADPRWVVTVRGAGYRFVDPSAPAVAAPGA